MDQCDAARQPHVLHSASMTADQTSPGMTTGIPKGWEYELAVTTPQSTNPPFEGQPVKAAAAKWL